MREVIFISGFKKELIRAWDYVEYYQAPPLHTMAMDNSLLAIDESTTITRKIAPVSHFVIGGRKDVYIAYSDEIEELIGIPINILQSQLENAQKNELRLSMKCGVLQKTENTINSMSWWDRWLFFLGRPLREFVK